MIAVADVAVVVSNSQKAAAWWSRKLGFATHTIGGAGHAVLVAPPGDRFILHLCEGFAPLEPGDTGIAFVTDEFTALVRRMVQGKVKFPEPPQKQSWGSMAKFADPDGNIFWLLVGPGALVRSAVKRRAPVRLRTSRKRTVRARR